MKRMMMMVAAGVLAAVLGLRGAGAMQIDQAMPPHPAASAAQDAPAVDPAYVERAKQIRAQDRTVFNSHVNLDGLRTLAVEHLDQVKIMDSWARQSLEAITHHKVYQGQDPLSTALDMAFRPEVWVDQNIIYVQAVPIRKELGRLVDDLKERQRMYVEGTISPLFFMRDDVQRELRKIAEDVRLGRSVEAIAVSFDTFRHLPDTLLMMPGQTATETWHHPLQLLANIPSEAAHAGTMPPVPGVTEGEARPIVAAYEDLYRGWVSNNVRATNTAIANLAGIMPLVNPDGYPSSFARGLELFYNRTFNGTILCVFIYLGALVMFMVASVGAWPAAWKPAMVFFATAVLCHGAFMAIRWYLAGRIPIQNEFESVLGSAFAGCVVGLILELRKKSGLFGLGFAFVGFLTMTACFVVPYAVGKNIGENISTVAGVLANTYWLYIHVNIVISSYALIGASFCMGSLYLLTKAYYLRAGKAGGGGEGVTPVPAGVGGAAVEYAGESSGVPARVRTFLEQLDAANMVVLQLAFWMLGTGIICGAIWADHSWGRPWGWDPKETFALVTWIVYLVIVHVRFVTPRNKGLWTSGLSILGFFVMMFNWIGVNFFLVGLHSYA